MALSAFFGDGNCENPDWGLMFKWFDEVGYSADIEGLREVKPDLIDLDHWLDAGRK